MSTERILLAAQGYIELDMLDDALSELDLLPAGDQEVEEVLQLRLFILMRARRWEDAVGVCGRLRAAVPEGTTGYIHGAFCLHELGRTHDAKRLLLAGPKSLMREATFFYNLACYDAVLGNLDEAENSLRVSFQMDRKFREIAKHDPDLRAVSHRL